MKTLTIVSILLLITVAIFTAHKQLSAPRLDGIWVTECVHNGFYEKSISRLSQNARFLDVRLTASLDGCDKRPAITITAHQKISYGLSGLPNVAFHHNIGPILMTIESDGVAAAANITGMYEFKHWEKGIAHDITGKRFNTMDQPMSQKAALWVPSIVDMLDKDRIRIQDIMPNGITTAILAAY